jgi:serine/threonine-protein kinase
MGEVYRADDLKLGQTVALKLLPDKLASDPARLAQFHNEVRVARTISHRNTAARTTSATLTAGRF